MKVEKIYFDMDGVLADFDRGIKELCGLEPRPQDSSLGSDADMWEKVKEVEHFYDKLFLMPGAKEMFDAVYSKYGDKCEILSAVPKPSRGILSAGDDKIKWVRRLHSEDIQINIVLKEEKRNYCTGKGCILVDDLEGNIQAWKDFGGTGILHKSSEETLGMFEKLGVL